MVRIALVGVVLAGCSDPTFTSLHIGYDEEFYDGLYTYLGGADETPCPVIARDDITLNGRPGDVREPGGEDGDPDSVFYGCFGAEISWDAVPLSDGQLEVIATGPDLKARAVVDIPDRVWTDDDLAAAYTNAAPFTVQWTAPALPAPTIRVAVGADQLSITLVDASDGEATYMFAGTIADPTLIRLVGDIDLAALPFTCSITDCSVADRLPFDVESPAP